MALNNWVVNKFGGTSVANAECFHQVRDIVFGIDPEYRVACVVSAMGGKPKTTDMLLNCVKCAAEVDEPGYRGWLEKITVKHKDCLENLGIPEDKIARLIGIIEKDMLDIIDLLRAVTLMRHQNDKLQELVSGYGEIWSAQMLQCYFDHLGYKCRFLNARDVLIVEEAPGGVTTTAPEVFWDQSQARMDALLADLEDDEHLVVTGFVATTDRGVATTLKRDGSDYSASIFGALLRARAITIWTDVDGVMSADPRRVPEAKVLAEVSYNEAMELAYFGAKVIHPKTMVPAVKAEIPLWIRNSFNPGARGTRIGPPSPFAAEKRTVCGFSTVDNVATINVEGTGMVGVPGVASKLFAALHERSINVNLIAQASSEHSICFVCSAADAKLAKDQVEETFQREIKQGYISKVDVLQPCSIVAIVGDAMSRTPGVSGRFFGALGQAKINVIAVSQGSSERNISAVVDARQSAKALRAAHAEFLLTEQVINVGLVGAGDLGGSAMDMFFERAGVLLERYNVRLQIRGICNSRVMLLSSGSSYLGTDWRQKLAESKTITDLQRFVEHVETDFVPHTLIIDCTRSEAVARAHVAWLEGGLHVLTASQLGVGGDLAHYYDIWRARGETLANYAYEVAVGCSLPIIGTLQNLHGSGDTIKMIEGAISATMTHVMALVSPLEGDPVPFSQACAQAIQNGYAERDPLDDLTGRDAARKLVILAREMGVEMEKHHVQAEAFVPANHQLNPEDVAGSLVEFDAGLAARVVEAAAKGCVLRYVGRVRQDGRATLQLEEVERGAGLARAAGCSFHVAFHTERFAEQPLVIAGPATTGKTGLFADLVRISRDLGARDKGSALQPTVRRRTLSLSSV